MDAMSDERIDAGGVFGGSALWVLNHACLAAWPTRSAALSPGCVRCSAVSRALGPNRQHV